MEDRSRHFIIEEVTITYRDPETRERYHRHVDIKRYDMLLWGDHVKEVIAPALREAYDRWAKEHADLAASREHIAIWEPLPLDVGPTPATMLSQGIPDPSSVVGPVCIHEWTCNLQCC